MEQELRAALIAHLRADPALSAINAIEEESPLSTSPPWLGIASSASTDWGTKDRTGREVRIALELVARSDEPAGLAALTLGIANSIEQLAASQPGFSIVTALFMRSRAEKRANNLRACLLEYRFRLLATS